MIKERRLASLATCTVALACTPNPKPQEQTMPTEIEVEGAPASARTIEHLSPRWRAGDEWDVHYRQEVSQWRTQVDAPTQYDEYDFHYAVGRIEADGTVSVDATAPELDPWRMLYARSGRLIAVRAPDDETEVPDDAPFVTLQTGGIVEDIAKYWPKFPLRPGEVERAEDGRWEQRVSSSGDKVTVMFIGRGEDHGMRIERTVSQEWERNRPWWSAISVTLELEYEGKVEKTFEIVGHVTAWRLAEGR